MTRPVSVVIPSLDDFDLLERDLPPLLEELAARAQGDEILVVDDTGRDALSDRLASSFPAVKVLARPENGGFAAALRSGIEAARHELVFAMNPDVRVRQGFLDPLVACLQEEDVSAVVPRVLLGGDEERIESLTELQWKEGMVEISQPGLDPGGEGPRLRILPVAFPIGGACLLKRKDFLDSGGFDPMYEPFYWEDVDWGWRAWRAGKRILYQPASVVEHHHRGTIGRLIEKDVVLDIAKRLRDLIQREPQWRVTLTRDTDVFMPLEERTAIANASGADLFVSIHANAAVRSDAHGIETYFLDLASDAQSMQVAARENATTVSKVNALQRILRDLSMTSKRNESSLLAGSVQRSMVHEPGAGKNGRDLGVKHAPFLVLMGAEMPSILVETGFLSHPGEERRLADPKYRAQAARAIFSGIKAYLSTTNGSLAHQVQR